MRGENETKEWDLWIHPEPQMIGTHRRMPMHLFQFGKMFNDSSELIRLTDVYDSLYEARRGTTAPQLKRCVAAIVSDNLPSWEQSKPEEVRAEVSRAFAICTKTLQRGGYMKAGTQTPTKLGASRGRSMAAEKGHAGRVKEYEKMLSVARGE